MIYGSFGAVPPRMVLHQIHPNLVQGQQTAETTSPDQTGTHDRMKFGEAEREPEEVEATNVPTSEALDG